MPAGQKSLSMLAIGDAGNAPDSTGVYGTVAYPYRIAKYDVTAAQYAQFLNAVAKSDPYALYSSAMAQGVGFAACGINRSGASGSYTYIVDAGREDMPVNFVNWLNAARFANWLTNGQPATGVEDAGTTESGSYALNGTLSAVGVVRLPTARYVLPSQNEWYKAAAYKGGSTNAGYWFFATQSDTPPSNTLSASGMNNANYYSSGYSDPTNYITPVGSFAGSPSAYGTFDQAGDVFQWNEFFDGLNNRGIAGGAFDLDTSYLYARSFRLSSPPNRADDIGFRIAWVPEPASALLFCGCLGLRLAFQRRPRGADKGTFRISR
jgi:formylglycine-generating enzyme required for sulfatase activity